MDLAEQLTRDEGSRSHAYLDTVGKVSVGVGRNLTDVGLSESEIQTLLANDIAKVRAQLAGYAWYQGLDPIRQGAIENMCFNIGLGGILHFPTMIHCLTVKDWQGASDAMLDSVWSKQVGARAFRLARQVLSGEWQ